MRVGLRWLSYIIGALVVLALIAAAWLWITSNQLLTNAPEPRAEHLVVPTPAALANAERRARTLGCFNCHGDAMQGRKFFEAPNVATIYAPNLPVLAGRASDQQLAQAIRQGIGADGRPLLVMPSEAYQFLTDEETAALVAVLRRLPRQGAKTPPVEIGPFGRVGLINGVLTPAPKLVAEYRERQPTDLGRQHAFGRHLAMTTCSGCHGATLAGRQVSPDTYAPDLVIAGAYDLPAFTRLLREGVAPAGKKLGLMREIALRDARFYTDEEIAALHAYLQARAQR